MERAGRLKASVLWGAIGALTFLVLAEAYVLFSGAAVTLTNLLVAGSVVFLIATLVSYVAEPRVHSRIQ